MFHLAAQVMPVAKSLNIHLHQWLSRIVLPSTLAAIAAPRLQGRSRGGLGRFAEFWANQDWKAVTEWSQCSHLGSQDGG